MALQRYSFRAGFCLLALGTGRASAVGTNWLGMADSNWSNAANWSGGVPTSLSEIVLPGNPPFLPTLPAGATNLRSITYDSLAVNYNLGTASDTISLTNQNPWDAITQASANPETINALLKVYWVVDNFSSSRIATINLSGSGGLNLPKGLQWGMFGSGSNNYLQIKGPGPLTAAGTFAGNLTNTGTTGGTTREIRLLGDAAAGSVVTFNPTDGSTWNSITSVTLGGRVTFNAANAAAFDTASFIFASGAQDASLIVTGTASGSTFGRLISFTPSAITGGTQRIGVDLPGAASAEFSSAISLGGTNNTVALSAGTGDTAVFSNIISGSRPVTILGPGKVTLLHQNTYTAPTTVSSGTLIVGVDSFAQLSASSTITVAAGAALGGAGTVGDVVLNGIISPGDNSTATFTTNAETWNPLAGYTWEINDAAGSAGASVGWDKLSFTTLAITADPLNPFTLKIAGAPANFDKTQNYSWLIASASTPGGISGFDPSKFLLDDSAFTTDHSPGHFSIHQSGDDLQLHFTPSDVPEPSTILLLTLAPLMLRRRQRHA